MDVRMLLGAAFLLMLLTGGGGAAEERSFLVLDLPANMNIVTSSCPAARVTRALVAPAVLRPGPNDTLDVAVARELSVDLEKHSVRCVLDRSATFSNGALVTGDDIEDSIASCGFRGGVIEEEGPHFAYRVDAGSLDQLWSALSVLAECPIIPKTLRARFGNEFGRGTNIVGASEWVLVKHEPGKRVRVERSTDGARDVIEIRKSSSLQAALDALVRAYADGVILAPSEVSERDIPETVLSQRCPRTTVLVRRDKFIPCPPGS
jgi:hypothetical protein